MQIFTREGEYWTVRYAGRVVRLRHSKGIGHLALLLGQPGLRLHVALLTGRSAAGGDASRVEQDRINVTKGIRGAIERIADHHPDLGLHLEHSIVTGTHCSYSPVVSPAGPAPSGSQRNPKGPKPCA